MNKFILTLFLFAIVAIGSTQASVTAKTVKLQTYCLEWEITSETRTNSSGVLETRWRRFCHNNGHVGYEYEWRSTAS